MYFYNLLIITLFLVGCASDGDRPNEYRKEGQLGLDGYYCWTNTRGGESCYKDTHWITR